MWSNKGKRIMASVIAIVMILAMIFSMALDVLL